MGNRLTDPYIDDLNCIKRLISEWVKYKSLIIAYDYDNTVFDYHNLGYEFNDLIELLRECKKYGSKFIVYSHSPIGRYDEMKTYLNSRDIPFDTINENIIELHNGSGKLFYNIFLDDRAGLKSAYTSLYVALSVMKEGPNDEKEAFEILKKMYEV
jgi:hypothetical protein